MQHDAPARYGSLDEIDFRYVAAETRSDIRTVRRVARGEAVRGVVGLAIRRELDRRVDASSTAHTTEGRI